MVNTEGMTFEEGSLIHAAKVVKVNGSSLLVRSEATHILPPQKASPLQVFSEALANRWHQFASVWTLSKKTLFQLGKRQSDVLDRRKISTDNKSGEKGELYNEYHKLIDYWRR